MSAFIFPLTTRVLASTFIGSTALRKGPEDSDYTAMIAFMLSSLGAKTHPGGKVVSAVIIYFFLLATIAFSIITAWLACYVS